MAADVENLRASLNVSEKRNEVKEPHYLVQTSDGKTLFLRSWSPSAKSDIAVLVFHGITAHSGAYGNMLATPLSKAGFNVLGIDLRGHGLSDGNRGDYPSKDRLVKDLCEVISFVKQRFPRVIILGHSLGVVTAIVAINNCIDKIDGIILLSAGRVPKPGVYKKPGFALSMKVIFSLIFNPGRPIIKYYRDGMMGIDDPLFNFAYSPRFMTILNAKKVAFPPTIAVPIMMGVGEYDEIFSVEAARALFEEINASNKEFMIMPGAKHAVFPEGSTNKLTTWLRENFMK
jgi:acylglycerol lipase